MSQAIQETDILFDAPPVERELEFNIQIHYAKQDRYRQFAEVSPIVRTFEHGRFDDYVKRVRVFASPAVVDSLRGLSDLRALVEQAIDRAG